MNVLDLAMTFGLQPQKVSSSNGGEFASPCPFCGGKDRFRIWPDQNTGSGSYWCRQCNAHGDRIQFVMDTHHLGFKAACRVTGDDAIAAEFKSDSDSPYTPRVPAPQKQTVYVPESKPAPPDLSSSDLWEEKAMKLVVWAAGNLPGSPGEQLLNKKGISMETATAHGLGWIPDDLYRTRESWGLSTVIKEDTGKPKRLWLPAGLVIPQFSKEIAGQLHISDKSVPDLQETNGENHPKMGFVHRLRIRRPEGNPRYYVIPGSGMSQMILPGPSRCVIVVESELDAILLGQMAGDITTVVSLGTSHAKPDTVVNAFLTDALCILVALDFDKAGQMGFRWWKDKFPRSVRWPVPCGKDPSDAHHEGVDLRAWVVAGWPSGWRLVKSGGRHDAKSSRISGAGEQNQTLPRNSQSENLPEEPETPLDELKRLMKKNPKIKIVINNSRLSLVAPSEWQWRNGSVFARISQLVYFDPMVFGFLHAHGSDVITCDNLI